MHLLYIITWIRLFIFHSHSFLFMFTRCLCHFKLPVFDWHNHLFFKSAWISCSLNVCQLSCPSFLVPIEVWDAMMFWHLDCRAMLYGAISKWMAVAQMCISSLFQEHGSCVSDMVHCLAELLCLQFGGLDTIFCQTPAVVRYVFSWLIWATFLECFWNCTKGFLR